MRIIFMGTPEFAVPSLDMLLKEGYDIAAVVTQPDKPKGRGNKIAYPPVKEYAIKNAIRVIQPQKVKTPEFAEELRALKPDLLVTAAYGRILPGGVLDIAPLGCINVHGSLLPKYRGAAPIQWSIINGEAVTGITTMYTDIGMDTGDMLLKKGIKISDEMTAGELHDKLSALGAEVLKETLERLKIGTLERVPQLDEEATYAPIMTKETGLIDWSGDCARIHNLVRGTNPWPGAYTFYKGERMRVWKTEAIDDLSCSGRPGCICKVTDGSIIAACGSGMVRILELQFDSCRRMTAEEYMRGHKIDEGEFLG
ncbi:methionyl-tRNA formyltransferase [Anaerobacterium chartisolvens]|uniref:Methionyl-tRNA formyltransferase n=1 Tax=Anaerobacterium chartisolvens TaxID=1297424 RepID=A0A369B5I9_9FIRM|nr:methionyl-tRNA formyltransferase [Anaerobacterium chartisolvens]RCX16780.1 methionyl-tRNA formyltransferase [Anaerobacterium chartisolvens]